MYLLKIFFYLISPIFVILIVISKPLILIRFCFLSSERIGELAYQTEKYFLIKENANRARSKDIFFTGNVIANRFFLSLLKNKLILLNNYFCMPIFRIFKFLSKKNKFFSSFIILHHEPFVKDFRKDKINFSKNKISIKIPKNDLERGNFFLKSLGINDKDKIILLYVRDNKYLKDKFPNKDFSYHDHRDCDINNFLPAIEYATKRGYFVFRMGENLKIKNININNKKFINYSSLYRSEFLDVYLSNRCSFIISTGGGFDTLASVSFRKPILSVNATSILNHILHECDQMIYSFKHHYDNRKKKYLSIKEILDKNVGKSLRKELYTNQNISLIESNSREIKDMTEDFIDFFEQGQKENYNSIIQNKINNILLKRFNFKNNEDIFCAKISKKFVEENQYLLRN